MFSNKLVPIKATEENVDTEKENKKSKNLEFHDYDKDESALKNEGDVMENDEEEPYENDHKRGFSFAPSPKSVKNTQDDKPINDSVVEV